jgi:hypothetical protein
MKDVFCVGIVFIVAAGGIPLARADIFEHVRPVDTALREALGRDRQAYYFQTPGVDHQQNMELISEVNILGADVLMRARGLRDMDKAFDTYLVEQLHKDRDYKSLVSLNHPLVLLEYASPVLADVVKHYRMTSYERLGIEQARLEGISRSIEGRSERLSNQSKWECLQRNENKGLVAAMRICQNSSKPWEMLMGIDAQVSLEDGRRKIHVVRESLVRLGFDKKHVDSIVDLTGEKVLSNDKCEERLPETTFEQKVISVRRVCLRQWHEILGKFHASARATPADLEKLSLPGVAVTVRVLADMDLLDEAERELIILKLASCQSFIQTEQIYRQAIGYLERSLTDPLLAEEFRNILREKRDFLAQSLERAHKDREEVDGYKALFASLADTVDVTRERLRRHMIPAIDAPSSSRNKYLMLNF